MNGRSQKQPEQMPRKTRGIEVGEERVMVEERGLNFRWSELWMFLWPPQLAYMTGRDWANVQSKGAGRRAKPAWVSIG